jgi:hypothetical protein
MESVMSVIHEGGCVCGAVRYKTHGDPIRVTVCHCTWCQRRTGTAFAVEPVFAEEQVEIGGGPRSTYRHISDLSGRWLDLEFCPNCGTSIGLTLEWRPGLRLIDAGTFDDPSWIRSDKHHFRHIFLRSAQNWSKVPAGVETYEAHFTM